MINTWFISDTHFGHTKILEYEKKARPFSTVEEMNEVLIDRWNSVVHERDIIYHLGDFCFGKSSIDIADRLKGKKRLVMGNHDNYPSADYLRYFEKLYGMTFWKGCILSHMPTHPNGLGSRWFINVHGHLHSHIVRKIKLGGYDAITDRHFSTAEDLSIPDINYFNVSVEQNNLTPIHADIILEKVKQVRNC